MIALLLCLGFAEAFAIDSKFERYTATKFGFSVTIDVMYMDRDGDGCYDYKVIWLNGDYFGEGPLLKAGGGGGGTGVAPSEWTSTGKLRDFDFSTCPSNPDTIRLVIKDTTNNSTIATMTQACGSATHTWTSSGSQLLMSVDYGTDLSNSSMTAYPNPVVGDVLNLRLTSAGDIAGVEIVSIDGTARRVDFNQEAANERATIELKNFPLGAYMLKVTLESGVVLTYPIVKN